jgi:hypothetical protein
MTTCHSNPAKVIGTLMSIEMGLRIVEFLDPFSFLAASTKTGEIIKFSTSIQDMNSDYTLFLHDNESDYLVILINGKRGDNAILIDSKNVKDNLGSSVTFEFIADKITKKWRYEFT